MFGNIDDVGYVKNVTINSGSVTGISVVGSVVGRNWGRVENCQNKNCYIMTPETVNTTDTGSIGGVVGANVKSGTTSNCSNYAKIMAKNAQYQVGGILGCNAGMVESCSNYGEVEAFKGIGGITGIQYSAEDSTTIKTEKCFNYGKVKGECYIGGIIGHVEAGKITKCKNNARIESTGNDYAEIGKYWSRTGGIAGFMENGSLTQCCNGKKGSVISQYGCVGGIVGLSYASILECYNLADITGIHEERSTNVGGIVGRIDNGTVNYTYNMGNINTNKGYVGGVAGQNNAGTIGNSYNTGNITIATSIKPSADIGNSDKYIGNVIGYNIGMCLPSAVYTTETTMNNWKIQEIQTKLGNNFKKGDSYPILDWEQ